MRDSSIRATEPRLDCSKWSALLSRPKDVAHWRSPGSLFDSRRFRTDLQQRPWRDIADHAYGSDVRAGAGPARAYTLVWDDPRAAGARCGLVSLTCRSLEPSGQKHCAGERGPGNFRAALLSCRSAIS